MTEATAFRDTSNANVAAELGTGPRTRRRREEPQPTSIPLVPEYGDGVLGSSGIDPRLLEKPERFSGDAGEWRLWQTTFPSWLESVDPRFERLLKEAEVQALPISSVHPTVRVLDRFLWHEPLGLVRGDSLQLILDTSSGFEAWRQLVLEHEKLTGGRKLLKIEDLLHPQFGSREVWRRSWREWEREMTRCASQIGVRIPDDLKIAIVRHRAPDELRQRLRVTAAQYEGNYNKFHDEVESYWKTLEGPSADPAKESREDASMQIDLLTSSRNAANWRSVSWWNGKGQACWHCNLRGHFARDCPLAHRAFEHNNSRQRVEQREADNDNVDAARVREGFRGWCFVCGKVGHRAWQCDRRARFVGDVHMLETNSTQRHHCSVSPVHGDEVVGTEFFLQSLEVEEPLGQKDGRGRRRLPVDGFDGEVMCPARADIGESDGSEPVSVKSVTRSSSREGASR
eukprot:TRINITY_DN73179_c0_g1_i1.p1 TRINITY_DN73179_c0_g1~~TRINITY_DN73179_c0_g1_i1.p1  ORF type:complete len:456 (+),score=40.33 TRINITY_DN73179_c0_g1_i1:77-1444(+)